MLKLTQKKRKARNRALWHLSRTMREDGGAILVALLKQKSTGAKGIPQTIRSLAQQAGERWKDTARSIRKKGIKKFSQKAVKSVVATTQSRLKDTSQVPRALKNEWANWIQNFQSLDTRKEKAELAALMGLYGLSFLSGIGIGYSLPQQNIRLTRKGQKQSFISLNAAPYFSVQLSLEYLKAVTAKAGLKRSLSADERRTLAAIERVLEHTLEGLSRGANVRRFQMGALSRKDKPSLPTINVPLEARAYAMMEHLFSVLVGQS